MVLLVAAAFAPPARATLRVESTGTGGLVLTDKNGSFDDQITLALVASASGIEWEINKTFRCGVVCIDVNRYELGPGCLPDGEEGAAGGDARCTRFNGKVTVNSLGGEDVFAIAPSSQAITESLTVNLGAGNDVAQGAAGADSFNGGSGEDILRGGTGNDALAGSAGNDLLEGQDGTDTLTGASENDTLIPGTGPDSSDGGPGDDRFALGTVVRDEKDQVQGGTGFDRATYSGLLIPRGFGVTGVGDTGFNGGVGVARTTPVRIVEANLESLGGEKDTNEFDVLRSIEGYGGGNGNDIVTGALSSNVGDYFGETGNDALFGTSGANTLIGGPGDDFLDGNAGPDIIDAKSGEAKAEKDSVIDCGAGQGDRAFIDLKDDLLPAGCEILERAPAGEEPHARPSARRLTRVLRGRASFRVSCPRTQRGRCAGRLGLRVGRARTKPTRFSDPSRRIAQGRGTSGGAWQEGQAPHGGPARRT